MGALILTNPRPFMIQTLDEIDELSTGIETNEVEISGTSRVGTLVASRKELTRQFGEPDYNFPKTTYHWQVRFPSGKVVTVYDYKEKNRFVDSDENVEWSIGGKSESVSDMFRFLGFEVK